MATAGRALADGLVWSEPSAALPGPGGSYLYLLGARVIRFRRGAGAAKQVSNG